MKPPTRKLIGGVGSYIPGSSCSRNQLKQAARRGDRRCRLKNSKNEKTKDRTRVFGQGERERVKRCHQGAWGPPRRVGGAARGLGRATWPSGWVVDPPVSHRGPLVAF